MNTDTLVEQIKLHLLRLDGGTQARISIDDSVVAEYAYSLRTGEVLPPVVVFFDGTEYWLADGFHRYHASLQAGLDQVRAEIRTGIRRDAVLYAVGANASHGLPRTNADKRRAVTMLLQDPEWVTWSDGHIARICRVSQPFVGSVRASLKTVMSETPAERTYITKHGTTALIQTAKVGKSKQAAFVTPSNSAELVSPDTVPEIATTCLSAELNAIAVSRMDELVAENGGRDELADLKAELAETLADNEEMGRVFDANDQVKAALAEAARYKALAENAERTLAASSQEFNERARNVVYWKNRAEKAEKQLTKTEATGESSALRAENAQLRAQLGELAEQFEATLAEAESMREIIEANVPLSEAMRKLSQTQELARVLETRVHGLMNEKSEVLRRYKGARHELDKFKQAHANFRTDAATLMVNGAASPPGDADLVSAELATLQAENGHLRTQLGDLALQFREAMNCYDEMLAILDTTVPLDKVPRQLGQALELARMWESRVAEAPRRRAGAQSEQGR